MNENDIAAVRRIRHEISEEFNHDVERVIAYYRSVQEELKRSGKFKFGREVVERVRAEPSEQAHSRGDQVCGGTGVDREESWPTSPCLGRHLLPVRPQGVLDVGLLDTQESRIACARYPANC